MQSNNNQQESVFNSPFHDASNKEPTSAIVGGDTIVKTFPDGSTVVGPVEQHAHHQNNRHHRENLASVLEDNEVREIGGILKDAIEDDIESQTKFWEAVSHIIKLMGLDLDSDGEKDDLPFKGAASVYSAKLFETLQSLNATVSRGIFKSSGMVDTCTVGHPDDQLNDTAERIRDFYNYYFDSISKDFRKKALQSANWTFVAGSAYKKVYICPVLRRPISEAIPIEDFIVNNVFSSHLTASRRTHRIYLSEKDYQTRVNMGLYRDIHISKQDDDGNGQDDVIKESLNKQLGYEPMGSKIDGMYVIYECHADLCIKGDDTVPNDNIPSPYIISMDAESGQVLRIARNWKEGDQIRKRIEYFVNYFMLSSLRGPGYGLVHYALRLAEAATTLERQTINAAIYSNFPGGVYQQGVRFDSNNLCPAPGEWVPLMASGSLRDAIMPLPYKEPSQALNDLRRDFEESIGKPSAILDQKIFDMPSNAPATTTLALLEQVHQVPNAIMQNFYESLTRELELYWDRFSEWLQPGNPYHFKVNGADRVITKEDFEASVRVIPSADPTTKNAAHRLIVSEIMLNNARTNPDVYDLKYANEMFLKQVGISKEDIEKLLSPKKDNTPPPQPMDPVSMMMALIKGEPVTAAVWQNHDAYIAIINSWIQMNQQDPHIQNAMALKTQYEAYKYMVDAYAALGMPPPQDPSQLTPEQQNQLAVQVAHMKVQEAQEAQAQAEQQQGPSPMDLAQVELESAKMQAQVAHEKNAIEMKKIEVSEKKIEMDHQLSIQEFDLKMKVQSLQAERESFKIAHDQAIKERDQALKEKEAAIEEMQHQNQNMEGISQ